MSDPNDEITKQLRCGGWLPASRSHHEEWLKKQVDEADSSLDPLHPTIQELKNMIDNDPDMYMGFNRMLEDGPVEDYNKLLKTMNMFLTRAPYFGPVGPPFYMLLERAMNTHGGFAAFLADKLNAQLKKILNVWAKFLESRGSTYVLTEDDQGWFSQKAIDALVQAFDPLQFDQIFECDRSKPHWGFNSWDHFFTRALRPGVRAVEYPEVTNAISAACESTFYKLKKNAQETDQFWIKGEPYSLRHMLNDEQHYAKQLYGGSVFQGFLAVTSYHRWHSPVTGTIEKIVTVPGTYYVQSPALIGSKDYPYLHSLAFLASISARMLIFIQSSNPKIGLMCFIAIGMVEVSSCEATVQAGQQVNRGDELGMFHFGGSTHCLVFGPGADIKWVNEEVGHEVKVRAVIGAVPE